MRLPRPAPSSLRRIRPVGRRLLRDSRGGTAIEYGLIMAFIVIAMFAALLALADETTGMWRDIDVKVRTASGN